MGKAGRLNSGLCLMCGDPLLLGVDEYPISGPYQCCSGCTDVIEKARYEVKKKAENKKLKTKTIVNSKNILRQLGYSGPRVEGAVKFGPSKIRSK